MNAPAKPACAPDGFSKAEFDALLRSGAFGRLRVELRRGAIRKMSPHDRRHARVFTLLLQAALEALAVQGEPILQFDGELSVAFGPDFTPMADIVIWNPNEGPIGDEDGLAPGQAVKLVIEVAHSSLRDDLGDKLKEYAASGLSEYWVADVEGRIFHQFADPSGESYRRAERRAFGERIAALTLPFEIDTSALP